MILGCIVYTIIHHIYNDKIWNVYALFKIWNSIYKNLSLLDAIANWRISISMILFLGILLISFALMTVKVDGYSIKTGLLIYMIKGCYYTLLFEFLGMYVIANIIVVNYTILIFVNLYIVFLWKDKTIIGIGNILPLGKIIVFLVNIFNLLLVA